MPSYDYICKACGSKHEFVQAITEGAKRKCPDCGKLQLQRQIGTGILVIFRGIPGRSGFHCLDYRKSEQDNHG